MFYDRVEFDSLTFEFANRDVRFKDVRRELIGARIMGLQKPLDLGAYLEVAYERLDLGDLDEEFQGVALHFGAEGFPNLLKAGDAVVFAEYRAGVASHVNSGHLEVVRGGKTEDIDTRIVYADLLVRAGFGVDVHGVRPSLGVVGSWIYGSMSPSHFRDINFSGGNVGGYVGVSYLGTEIPLTVRVEATLGELQGVVASVGIRF